MSEATFKIKVSHALSACILAERQFQQEMEMAWSRAIRDEMNLPPFLGLFDRAAKTREEAIKRIKDRLELSPDFAEKMCLSRIRKLHAALINVEKVCEYVFLTEEQVSLLGRMHSE